MLTLVIKNNNLFLQYRALTTKATIFAIWCIFCGNNFRKIAVYVAKMQTIRIMKLQSIFLTFASMVILLALATLPSSCTTDKLDPIPEPEFCDTLVTSYQLNIQAIVETYCAYSGCHDGSSPGVYLSYEGMLPSLDNGKIMNRAINSRDMPPSYANEGLTELPDATYDMLNCWIEEGYPEQ